MGVPQTFSKLFSLREITLDGQVLVKLDRWYKFDRLQSRFTQRSSVYSARRKPLTMFHLAGKTFLVLSFISFLGSNRSFAESRDVIEGLDLEVQRETLRSKAVITTTIRSASASILSSIQ